MNFNLPFIPERTLKPRSSGVTMVMDKGLSIREAENFVEGNSEFCDLVKFGFGTAMVTQHLEKKLEIYRSAGMRPYFGGTLFEAFIARNMFEDYLRLLDKYKLDLAEVSDGSIIIPHGKKLEYIRKMGERCTVLSEVGSKEQGILISPGKWIKMMSTELEAGSWMVIAEGRESGTVGIFRPNGTPHTILINKIINKVPIERIMWEAPIKSQQVWFIKLFGANVNLGNIAPNELVAMECLRLGLRGDTFFEYLPTELKEKLKQSD
jgi:phosphosulfolactate synthase